MRPTPQFDNTVDLPDNDGLEHQWRRGLSRLDAHEQIVPLHWHSCFEAPWFYSLLAGWSQWRKNAKHVPGAVGRTGEDCSWTT